MYKINRKHKTKRRIKDIDEIDNDLKPENVGKLLNQEVDFDKPGDGQYYCVHCARYFINGEVLSQHYRTKGHKRRLKELQEEPYTIEESERAGGMGSYVSPKRRKIETLLPKSMENAEKMELDDDDVKLKEKKTE